MKNELEDIGAMLDSMVVSLMDEGRNEWFMTEAAINAQNALEDAREANSHLTAAVARAIESLQPLREHLTQIDEAFASCHNARVGLEDIAGGHLGFTTVEALLAWERTRQLQQPA
jgi:hypothetical protein